MNKETGEQQITVTMTKRRYFNLLKSELKLTMLEMGGVDNWDWYGEALNPDGEQSYGEEVDMLDEQISKMEVSNL